MMGKTHRAGAVLLSIPALFPILHLTGSTLTEITAVSCFVGGSLLSSRLPDIDEPYSSVGRKLWLISWIMSVLHALFQFFHVLTFKKFPFLKRITKAAGHRGISHTFFFWILFSLVLTALYRSLGIFLTIPDLILQRLLLFFLGLGYGYLSHLFLDYFSGSLRLYEPFSYKKSGKNIIPTNSIREKLLYLFFLSIDLLFLFLYLIWYASHTIDLSSHLPF